MEMFDSRVRFVGSRELHRDLPKVLENLEDSSARYVVTIHSRPKAVLIGTDAFLKLLRGYSNADRLLAAQLGALVQGLESADESGFESVDPAVAEPVGQLAAAGV
jgi:PHD/YefM family antitoxin component YafN of YafNO toxin-antitoxin module